MLSTPSLSSSPTTCFGSQPLGCPTGLPLSCSWVLQSTFHIAPEPSSYAENLIMPVPISQPSGGCSWREILSSPCHSRPLLIDVNAIVFLWFLLYSLLPSSHVDSFSVPMQKAGLPHVAFAHKSPPLGALPLPFLFVQILLILKPR